MAKPIAKYRKGGIQISTFENTTTKGTMKSYNLRKQYKDGDDWKETSSYNLNELLQLRQVIDTVIDNESPVTVEKEEVAF